MTPTLRVAAPTQRQIGDVRPPHAVSTDGDPAHTFDASFAAALKGRPVSRDAGSVDGQAKGPQGEAVAASAAGTPTATAAADGVSDAPASPPADGTTDEATPAGPAATAYTLLNALVAACAPTQPADGVAAGTGADALATTPVPGAQTTVAMPANVIDAAVLSADGISPSVISTPLAATPPAAALPDGGLAAALPAADQAVAAPTASASASVPQAPLAPAGTNSNVPAAPVVGGAQSPVAAATVATLTASATSGSAATAPSADTAPDGVASPTGATRLAVPAIAGAQSGDASAGLPAGGQPHAPTTTLDSADAAISTLPASSGMTVVGSTDGETVAIPLATTGQVVDESTAVAYGVPGTDALKRAGAMADAIDATPVELASPAPSSAPDGPSAPMAAGGGSAPQPAASAVPRDVPPALPTVTAAAPAPAPTPAATATPTQQSNLPGSVPPPHQQIATAVSPLLRRADGSYSVNINLEPEHLGRVSLQVHIRGGEVAVTMQAADASARELLRDNLGQLRQQLEQQGVKAGQLDVRDDSAFARQFNSPQGDGRTADNRVSGHHTAGPGSDEPTSPDSSLKESTNARTDDSGALDLHL